MVEELQADGSQPMPAGDRVGYPIVFFIEESPNAHSSQFGVRMLRILRSCPQHRALPGGAGIDGTKAFDSRDHGCRNMPAGLTDRVVMTRGIAPVSAGPGIGGLIQAESKRSRFVSDGDFRLTGDAIVSLMSNDGTAFSGFIELSNSLHRFHALASVENGDVIESGDGTIGATDHDRTTYGAGYGYRCDTGEIGIDLSHTDTESTGTPALPLDIDFFE